MTSFEQEHKALEAQVLRARERLGALEAKVRLVDGELQGLLAQQEPYRLLTTICEALGKLEEAGAGHLFWGEQSVQDEQGLLVRARNNAAEFNASIADAQKRKHALEDQVEAEWCAIDVLVDDIRELEDQEERRKSEFLIEREASDLPYRPMAMPWDPSGEDGWRFRKVMSMAMAVTLSLGTLFSLWTLPPKEEAAVIVVPERLVKLVKKEAPPPPVARTKKAEEKPEEKVAEKKPKETKPATAEVKQARARAEGAGVLAFKHNFADLMEGMDEPKLGIEAKLGADMRKGGGSQAVGLTTQRSLVVAQATGGSGGINTASLSRNVGGGSGGGSGRGITGVGFSRVTDAIGDAVGDADRPLSSGVRPSRTDEEIQIVFDRYKAALYRIYNRELRNDPTLRGKMVLRITIEPGGEVSLCKVETTDLASAVLSTEVVERVKRFNFGPKENVARVTILYPIDFLPAS